MSRSVEEQNRKSWNLATPIHNAHKIDQAAFLKAGHSTLFPEELELLGELRSRRLVHLQCNCGQDTLSLALRGAEVTGIDISDAAVAFARQLASDAEITAEFVRSDVYTWFETASAANELFDVAFASYGALPWLRDLEQWAQGVRSILKPSGRLVLVEFHPVAMLFDENWRPIYPYGSGARPFDEREGVGDYVGSSGGGLSPSGHRELDESFENPEPCIEFYWNTSQVILALHSAGLQVTRFEEWRHVNGCKIWNELRPDGPKRFLPPKKFEHIPMMYGLVATLR